MEVHVGTGQGDSLIKVTEDIIGEHRRNSPGHGLQVTVSDTGDLFGITDEFHQRFQQMEQEDQG